MLRVIVLVLLAVGVLWWLIGRARRDDSAAPPAQPSARPSSRPPAPDPKAAPAEMVACAHCGVHLPQPDALPGPDGRVYCSEAHRLAGPGAAG